MEPPTGHLKPDYRLTRNFHESAAGDAVNVLPAAAAYDFKRAMRALWYILQKNLRDTVEGQYLAVMDF